MDFSYPEKNQHNDASASFNLLLISEIRDGFAQKWSISSLKEIKEKHSPTAICFVKATKKPITLLAD